MALQNLGQADRESLTALYSRSTEFPRWYRDARMRFGVFWEGLCAQMMHLGSFSEEAPTIEKIHLFIEERGAKRVPRFELHEMLLSRLEGLKPREVRYTDRLRYLDVQGGALVVLVGGTSGSGKSTVAAECGALALHETAFIHQPRGSG